MRKMGPGWCGWLGLLALLLLGGPEVRAEARSPIEPPFQAKVVRVFDGDTVEVLRDQVPLRIRLEGIDCPERAQAWSRKATELTTRLAAGKTATIRVLDVDRHYAWFNHEDALARLESEARAARRGIWSDPDPEAPWDFRRRRR